MKKLFFSLLFVCLCVFSFASATTLTIPAGVKEIEEEAFYGDTSLDEVVLPDGIERIGARAFAESSLKKINLPSSLVEIADDAFSSTQIEEITSISSSVGLEFVTSHNINVGSSSISFSDFNIVIVNNFPNFLRTTVRLVQYTGTDSIVYVPNGITSIAFAAFDNSSIEEIHFPASVDTLEFAWNNGCNNVKQFYFADDNPEYSSVDGVIFSKDKKQLIQYPAGRISEKYQIPDGTEMVWHTAFQNSWIAKVVVPASVSELGVSVIRSTDEDGTYHYSYWSYTPFSSARIESVYVDRENVTYSSYDDALYSKNGEKLIVYPAEKEQEFVLEDAFHPNMREIDKNAFESNHYIKELRLPSTIDIGQLSFSRMTSLESFAYSEGVETISSYVFYECPNLKKVLLPTTVKKIGGMAFCECYALSEVYIPAKDVEIEDPDEWGYSRPLLRNCPNAVVYGISGGSVEKYCNEKGIPFVPKKSNDIELYLSSFETNINEEVVALVFSSKQTADTEYSFAVYEGENEIIHTNWGSDNRYSFCINHTGQFTVVGYSRTGGKEERSAPKTFEVVDRTSDDDSSENPKTDHQEYIKQTIIKLCETEMTPDTVIGVMKDESFSAIDRLVMGAEDVANFNLSDLNIPYNKIQYLFSDALKRCAAGKRIKYNKVDMVPDCVKAIGAGGKLEKARLIEAFDAMCDSEYLQYLPDNSTKDLIGEFIAGSLSEEELSSQLSLGLNDDTIAYVLGEADWLKHLAIAGEVQTGIANAQKYYNNTIDVVNQISLLNSMDETKLREVAAAYTLSDDFEMQLVGNRLTGYLRANYEQRVAMIITGKFVDLGMDAIMDKIADAFTSSFSGVFTATVKLTDAILNWTTGVGDLPKKTFELNYAATAVRKSYDYLQSALEKYNEFQHEVTFQHVYYADLNYLEVCASCEDAFLEIYKVVDDSAVGSVFITDEMRTIMANAEKNKAAMETLIAKRKACYEYWQNGDYEEFVASLEQAQKDYWDAISEPTSFSSGGGDGSGGGGGGGR